MYLPLLSIIKHVFLSQTERVEFIYFFSVRDSTVTRRMKENRFISSLFLKPALNWALKQNYRWSKTVHVKMCEIRNMKCLLVTPEFSFFYGVAAVT